MKLIKKILSYLSLSIISLHALTQIQDGVKKFSSAELLAKAKEQKQNWYQFLNEETMSAGIFSIEAGQKDNQTPHEFDEVYYVLAGKGNLLAGDRSITALKGSIIYLRAGIKHHFFDITENLAALVVFSKANSNSADSIAESWGLEQLASKEKPGEVVWEPFLRSHTMLFGMYIMPKSTGGDSTQTHPIDEINIVTKGSSKFSVDGKVMDVKEGDVFYVRKQQGHYFHDLDGDLDVLILFEKKSIQK